jgi:uncharacterized membrane protein
MLARLQAAIAAVRFNPRWFFALYLLAGLPYLILTGPFRAADERNHFLRSYEISEGRFFSARVLGNSTGDDLPASLSRLSEALGIHSVQRIEPAQLTVARGLQLNRQEREFIEFSTAVYSPLAYLPSATAIALGRICGAGPLALVYFARAGNLLLGSWLMALALSYAGYARRAMLLVTILPMTVFQVATVTADAMSYGLGFLWISLVIDTAVAGSREAGPRRMLFLIALGLAISQLRPPYPLLGLLVFLIPIGRYGTKTILLWFAVIAASLLPAVAWNGSAARMFKLAPVAPNVQPVEQARWVLKDAGVFWHRAKQDLKNRGAEYWEQFVGRLGWLNIYLPSWIPAGFALVLAIGIFTGPRDPPSPFWWQRVALGLVAAGGIFAVQLMLYLTFNPVKSPFILGVQGRYFTPLAVLAAFAFSNSLLTRPSFERVYKLGALLFAISAHCAALFAVGRASGKI